MKIVFFVVALSVGLMVSHLAFPCTCLERLSVPANVQLSTAVFHGTMKEQAAWENSDQFLLVKFNVRNVWKGPITPEISVLTGINCGLCGVHFEVGKDYIVYASFYQDYGLSTDICSRTD